MWVYGVRRLALAAALLSIGLSTFTYLFDGEITHRDSLGVEQVIRPGEVSWIPPVGASATPSGSRAPSVETRGGWS